MDKNTNAIAYVVESDAVSRLWCEDLLRSMGLEVAGFSKADDFLRDVDVSRPCCLVLEALLPGMSGLALQQHLNEQCMRIPLIFISAYADVATAVRAMKAGAADFLEKPLKASVLLDAVQQALGRDRNRAQGIAYQQEVQGLMGRLTPREGEVLQLIMTGLSNKEMAKKIGVSPKTIEAHRANLYSKMRADSLADLVRKGLAGSGN
jgi:FixJ family two-component response regulator